jgi:hypothetical protein
MAHDAPSFLVVFDAPPSLPETLWLHQAQSSAYGKPVAHAETGQNPTVGAVGLAVNT